MNTTARKQCATTVLLLSFLATTHAQEQGRFNQNASRSNHTRVSFAFSPTYAVPLKSKDDSLLFRGNGAGFRFGADYSFGKAGIGFSSGFSSSAADDATINNFLKRSAIPPDQLTITKARQQNMYLLAGPSFHTGNMVEFYAHAKAGLFINNSGLVNLQQKGAQRAAYRNESTGKSLYPGFLTGMSVLYKVKSDLWSFGVSMDYMNTKTEVNNFDARRGGGIEGLKLSQNISDLVAGITIRYNILSPRDHASGQSTGRLLPTVNKREITSPRDPSSGMATGRRLAPRDLSSGMPTGRINMEESCGPVVQKITNPDGTTEEMTFACPADAEQYNRTRKVTIGKQTQGATFGEKVNQGLHAAGGMLASGASRGIISGRISWASSGSSKAIVTNNTTHGGSERTTPNNSFGTMVRLSARDASSGMATGRRQYEPIFSENNGEVCNPCVATARKGMEGTNPLYEGNKNDLRAVKVGNTIDENCDGIVGVNVSLVDINSDAVIATTKTAACGEFFFANVPEGNYSVRLTAELATQKTYNVTTPSKMDVSGAIELGNDAIEVFINTDNNNGMEQRAGVSTSRSNIRTKTITIVEADTDGDGQFESIRAIATFSDGTSSDITADIKSGTITLKGDDLQMSRHRVEVLKSNKNISSIILSPAGDGVKATATYSDGSSQDITNDISSNTAHAQVKQYSITIADNDGDGAAEASINTTRSNIKRNKSMTNDTDPDEIWSPRSNFRKMIPITIPDITGDGKPVLAAMPTEFVILRERLKGHFETGDVPTSQQRAGPIKGVIVKGGRNPGSDIGARTTTENGEFEFTGLEAGDYTFTISQTLLLDDETIVWVSGEQADNINTSEDNIHSKDMKVSTSQNPQTLRSQNNNTVRSNRHELKSISTDADMDGDGEYETDVTAKINYQVIIDENGKIEAPQTTTGTGTSKIVIKNNPALQSVGGDLYISNGTAIINGKEVPIQTILKTKHDTVKNSINNVR